jgi:hypothetical protein
MMYSISILLMMGGEMWITRVRQKGTFLIVEDDCDVIVLHSHEFPGDFVEQGIGP